MESWRSDTGGGIRRGAEGQGLQGLKPPGEKTPGRPCMGATSPPLLVPGLVTVLPPLCPPASHPSLLGWLLYPPANVQVKFYVKFSRRKDELQHMKQRFLASVDPVQGLARGAGWGRGWKCGGEAGPLTAVGCASFNTFQGSTCPRSPRLTPSPAQTEAAALPFLRLFRKVGAPCSLLGDPLDLDCQQQKPGRTPQV